MVMADRRTRIRRVRHCSPPDRSAISATCKTARVPPRPNRTYQFSLLPNFDQTREVQVVSIVTAK